ncbi:MAG: TraB/GumN family protein [Chitinophagaceae bacterium]
MKIIYSFLLAFAGFIFMGSGVCAQDKSGGGTLLWKISGNKLSAPSYLFGTMHIVCPDDLILSPTLEKAINTTGQTYMELDMDDMGEMMGMFKILQMKGGKKLKDLLTKEEYDKVKTFFTTVKSPIPFAMMEGYKPMLVSSIIFQQLMDCGATEGMEALIMKKVKANGQEIYGLETAAFQGGIFDSIPYELQAKELVKSIDSLESNKKMVNEMLEVYRKQDMVKLEKMLLESDPTIAAYSDLLLYERNRNWVEKIPSIIKEKPTLFAVGAGHLVGEKGVVELLRKEGYKVEAVK